jgi:membrane protein implicated in regulation of membrane protease activity
MDIGWILLLIGALLLLAEAILPGFFIIVPGTILVILGGFIILVPNILSYSWSPLLFAIITIVVGVLTIMFYKRLAPVHKPFTTSRDNLGGKTGEVLKAIVPGTIDGKVKINQQIWSATSDEPITVGEKIIVDHSSGVHLFVKKVK